jgi:Winged helix-turn helix
MRGRPSRLKVEIDDSTRATLESWLRRQTIAAGLATRARAMLLLADGQPYTHTAQQVGLAERHVRKWAKRFVAAGIAGLQDRPRPGRPPAFPPRGGAARGQDRL